MSPVEVLVVFVGAPIAVFAACWLLALWGSARHRSTAKRGSQWDGEPLWFVGRPRESVSSQRMARALESGTPPHATAGAATVVGGASGTW